jgi:hypothetical protein
MTKKDLFGLVSKEAVSYVRAMKDTPLWTQILCDPYEQNNFDIRIARFVKLYCTLETMEDIEAFVTPLGGKIDLNVVFMYYADNREIPRVYEKIFPPATTCVHCTLAAFAFEDKNCPVVRGIWGGGKIALHELLDACTIDGCTAFADTVAKKHVFYDRMDDSPGEIVRTEAILRYTLRLPFLKSAQKAERKTTRNHLFEL